MIPAPPSPFPGVNTRVLAAGERLHRVGDAGFDPNEFNPGLGRQSRFAPLRPGSASCIPHLYAASTFEAAVHETIFHDVDFASPLKTVPFGDLNGQAAGEIEVARDLTMACLFTPDLAAWGISRAQLIDTYSIDYPDTVKWALAIHDAHPHIDGLVWTSKRCDPEVAYIFFGDRVSAADFSVLSKVEIATSDPLVAQIRQFGLRSDIRITL